jgi:predicted nucleic acid-binding protein
MTFDAIPQGSAVFVDANSLLYYFTAHPRYGPSCQRLIDRIQTGLLCGDAMVVAVMRANGLTELASNDPDFDRVTGLTRYAPV